VLSKLCGVYLHQLNCNFDNTVDTSNPSINFNKATYFPSLNTKSFGWKGTAFSHIAILTTVPFALFALQAASSPTATPAQSKTRSTPSPPVSSCTRATMSSFRGSSITSVPNLRANFCRGRELRDDDLATGLSAEALNHCYANRPASKDQDIRVLLQRTLRDSIPADSQWLN
jgi:hypothetical protein